jgi:hypothetical protein
MPYLNEHAAPLRNKNDFSKKAWKRTNGGTIYGRIKVPTTVGIIWGKLKGKDKPADPVLPQSLRFNKKSWSVAKAKQWLKKNNIKNIGFEKAKTTSESDEGDMDVVTNTVNQNINADDKTSFDKITLTFNGGQLEIKPVTEEG